MSKEDKRIFLDTDVFLCASDEGCRCHEDCLALLEEGLDCRMGLFTSGQVLREYMAVATRPESTNGLGMSPAHAAANVHEFRRCVHMLDETAVVANRLAELVGGRNLRDTQTEDANIAATMMENGMRHLVTCNAEDFGPFASIERHAPDACAFALLQGRVPVV